MKNWLSTRKIILVLCILVIALAIQFTTPPTYDPPQFPNGKKFAFAIVDDTDGATVENIKPVYEYLEELGIRCTKTVWLLPTNDSTHWPNRGETMQDSAYREFVLGLQNKGFEIGLHGVRGGHSERGEVISGLESFRELFGQYPRIHINHSLNKDNLYWGGSKLGVTPFRLMYGLMSDTPSSYGQDPASEHFWGDIAKEHVSYVVNFSFHDINILKINPAIPYHDERKPYVNYWFHSADGGFVDSFNDLISEENVDKLESQGGVCFVYTHLSSGFARDGKVNPEFKKRIAYLASKDGWFTSASEILDYLREHRNRDDDISFRERIYIELRWLIEKALYGST